MIQHLYLDADICNFHISTLNLERSTRLILEALHLHTVGKVIYIARLERKEKKRKKKNTHSFILFSLLKQVKYHLGHLLAILLVQNYGMNFLTDVTVIRAHLHTEK